MTGYAYLYLAIVIICCAAIVFSVKVERKKTATIGKVLFSLRSKLTDRILLGIAILLTIVYLGSIIYDVVANNSNLVEELFKGFFWIAWGYFIWLTQGKNTKLTENGLSYIGSFFKWEDIASWKWSKDDKTIIITVKAVNKLKKVTNLQFKVNKKSHDKVNAILLKYKGEIKRFKSGWFFDEIENEKN